jgi:hypothetical protein
MREKIGVFLVILFIGLVAYADSPYTNKPISPPEGSTNITTLGTVTIGDWNAEKIGISYGGTNATNATDARTNLGLAIGSDVQAYDADLDIWAGITPSTDIQAFLGAANDTAARTELGLGSLATQNADNAIVTNLTANVIKTDTSADATLSGTPIIITVYDAASNTPYYFKAYPTK